MTTSFDPRPLLRTCALAAIMVVPAIEIASAQPPTPPQPPVINLDEEFVIEGRVQKPEAFYFLRRTPIGYVIRSLDQDFLDEIVRAVSSEPF